MISLHIVDFADPFPSSHSPSYTPFLRQTPSICILSKQTIERKLAYVSVSKEIQEKLDVLVSTPSRNTNMIWNPSKDGVLLTGMKSWGSRENQKNKSLSVYRKISIPDSDEDDSMASLRNIYHLFLQLYHLVPHHHRHRRHHHRHRHYHHHRRHHHHRIMTISHLDFITFGKAGQ